MHKLLLLLITTFTLFTVDAKYYYWVVYTDKDSSEFTLENPAAFLTESALARRELFNIPLDKSDLPVSNFYNHQISQVGADIKFISKWLNGVVLETQNPSFEDLVMAFPFVKEVHQILQPKKSVTYDKLKLKDESLNKILKPRKVEIFGFSENQSTMVWGDMLHERGLRGANIDIAVMDNGFFGINQDENSFFDHALSENRIHSVFNFVENNTDVFSEQMGTHGTRVLSTMAANKQNNYIGAAPEANFYLFITEDNATEGIHEEIYWSIAAEMADTLLGMNVILSTSLGYSNGFDNPAQEYMYADMDGNTTIITRAANLAASKGMLVVNSAGNSGNKDWRYITAPADGFNVLSVGAVYEDGLVANFSSRGPNAIDDLKPNVMAQGVRAAVIDEQGRILASSGTSFSCPIISGFAASLWQAFPENPAQDIFKAIQKSAHIYNNPDYDYGYGIPNFDVAYELLSSDFNLDSEDTFLAYPSPFSDELRVAIYFPEDGIYDLAIYDLMGKIWFERRGIANGYHIFTDVRQLPAGSYILRVDRGRDRLEKKIMKAHK